MQKSSSIIDRPQRDLDPRIFFNLKLRRDVRNKILDFVFKKLKHFKKINFWLQDIVIGGSFTTNQYREDSDMDVGILVDFERMVFCNPSLKSTEFAYLTLRNLFSKTLWINGVEISFLVARRGKEYPSPGLYSVLNDYWIREPFFLPLEINPDELFSIFKAIALLLSCLFRLLLKLEGGAFIVLRIINSLEHKRELENLQRGDYNELNIIYKYLEERYNLEEIRMEAKRLVNCLRR